MSERLRLLHFFSAPFVVCNIFMINNFQQPLLQASVLRDLSEISLI